MASGLGKRKRSENEWDVSEIKECPNATVHGVVTQLSPVKTSRKNSSVRYLDRRMSNGKKSVRVVCLDPTKRGALVDARAKGSASHRHLQNALQVGTRALLFVQGSRLLSCPVFYEALPLFLRCFQLLSLLAISL